LRGVKKNTCRPRPILNRVVEGQMLATALGLSALLTAVAITYPDCHWLAWFSLMPLFVAIRRLSSGWATWCGALWGGGIYLFASILPGGAIPNPDINAIALVAIPAAYAGLMALYSRRFGYSPLALALGWITISLCSASIEIGHAFDSLDYGHEPVIRLITSFLGSAFVAFVIAYTNALLLSVAGYLNVGIGTYYAQRSDRNVLSRIIIAETNPERDPILHPSGCRAPPA